MTPNHEPVLVTGGSGFIGAAVARALIQRGTPAVLLDIEPPRAADANDPLAKAPFVAADVTDPFALARAAKEHAVRRLVHAAAIVGAGISMTKPAATVAANVEGAVNVLECWRTFGLGRVVFVGSQSVYGPGRYQPVDEDHPKEPDSPYGVSKLFAESLARNYRAIWGVDSVTLRLPHVYGPGRPAGLRGNVIQEMLEAAQGGRTFVMETGGDQRKEPVYVTDAVRALLAALDAPAAGLPFREINVGLGKVHTWREIAAAVGRLYPKAAFALGPGPKEVYPGVIEQPLGPLSLARAKAALGYEPLFPLEKGLRDFAEWLAARRG
jgi:nucleoside-diphosphate-sugar epimerase